MSDGAHLGYGMEAAMRGALGGEGPPKRMDVNEMREYIVSAPDVPVSYDDAGRGIAKLVLGFMQRHPEAGEMPAESEMHWPKKDDGSTDWSAKPIIDREGLSEYMKRIEPMLLKYSVAYEGCSGFQWGWGVNAARYCLEMPPVPNPAIMEIG